jgi:TonB-linked SusC/RagA family outer membrane protein
MKRILTFFTLLLITGSIVMAQTVQISGTVTAQEDGSPIPGANVTVKGTTIGAITGPDGRYQLTVPTNATTLVFSFIGMAEQEVLIEGRTTINATLTTELVSVEEVVVVAYGTAKRVGTVVGSVTQVNSAKIIEKPVANIFDALQGKVAGLQVYTSSGEPSQLSSIRLHGVGSLSASSTPLYVMDGVPINSDAMLSLNPNDFESVTILKDASATSIYGSRAANGVIYITTKRGSANTAPIVTVRTQYGFSTLANLDYFNSFMNTKELTDFWIASGYRTQAQVDQLLTDYPNDYKWYKFYYKDQAPTYQGDVSVAGGGGKTTYFVSGSYFFQDGLAYRSAYDRKTMRSNIDSKLNNWLSIGLNLTAGTDTRQTNPYGTNSTNRGLALLAQPFYTPYDKDGKEYPDMIPGWGRYNPKYLANKNPSEANNIQFDVMSYIQLTPMKGLTIRSQVGMDAYDYRSFSRTLPSSLQSLNNGYSREDFSRSVTRTITNTAEYKFTLLSDHNITVLIGQEGIDNTYTSFWGESRGQTDDRLMLLSHGPNSRAVSSGKSEYAYLSFFSRIDYGFRDKYFVDFSARRDASSRFGRLNRDAYFYAGGVMWNAKKEGFLQDLAFLSTLSVKVSIGTSGNSEIGNYANLALVGTNTYDNATGWAISSPGNPDLGWENQLKTTAGLKFSLFRDKYRFNIEFYDRRTSNMLINVPYPYTSGFSEVLSNVGTLKNTGVDLAFDLDILRTRDYYITPYLNINYNSDKVTELFQGKEYWNIPNTGVTWAVGKPVSYFYPLFAGVDPADGQPMWYVPGTDVTETTRETTTKTFVSANLLQNVGKRRNTPISGGFGLNTGWHGIALQADFAYAWGKNMINNDRYFFENPNVFGGFNQKKRIADFWKQEGDETLFPAYSAQFTQFDSRLVEDASFMRLKNLTLSYNLPVNLVSKTKIISGAKVFATGRNLLTFTKYMGPDPEVDSNIGLGTNPNTKQYSFGIEVSF